MFEGIKDTLGKFRKDVEEEAVEEVPDEEVPDEDPAGEDPDEDPAKEGSKGETDESVSGAEVEEDVPEGDTEKAGDGDLSEDDSTKTASIEPYARNPSNSGSIRGTTGSQKDAETTPDEGDTSVDDAEKTQTVDADANADTAEADTDTSEGDGTDESTGIGRRAKSLVRGRVVIDPDDLEGPLRDLELALLRNDVEMEVADAILDRIREELVGETRKITQGTTGVVEDALREALLSVLTVGQFDFDDRVADASKPVVIVFTGVNGVGKTTTIAKLSRYLETQGYSSVLANGDTYRAGANEQIEEHANNLGRRCIAHEQGGDPAAVVYDAVEYAEANDVDVVLGDTAGRLHTDDDLMNQLAKINRVVDPDLTLFVDEAVAGQDAVNRAREFNEAAAIDGAVLTKADADSSGGAAISIAHVTDKPILFLGVGQGYEDLQQFDPESLVNRLLET